MKLKAPVFALVALSLLGACSGPGLNSQPQRGVTAQSVRTRVEDLVDRSRIEKHEAALSGKAAIGAEGLIPERGSTKGRTMARSYLSKTLESLGYKVEQHNYRPNGTNIMTRLMASKPTDEYIVLGAHLDSVSNAGADDNGSGSSAVLEAATVLKELPNRQVNILFAWFD